MEPPAFTGERYVPGQGGAQIAYEHLHRYLFAQRWVKDRQVLDLAAGTGYGALMLSKSARRVVAIDLDQGAVGFARASFGASNLQFCCADAIQLPVHSSSMDVVVAFEIVEHVADQKGLIHEIARVLRPEGVALISTPDKAAYSDARNYSNPFHVHEFYREEFIELLAQHFKHAYLMSQQVCAGSLIFSQHGSIREGEIVVEGPPGPERTVSLPPYLLAFCTNSERLLGALPMSSAYLDPTDYLLEEWHKEAERLNREIEALGQWGKTLEGTVKSKDESLSQALGEVKLRDERIESLEATVVARDETIRGLYEEMKQEISARDQALSQLQSEFEERSRWATQLNEEVTRFELVKQAFVYRVLRKLGILPK